MIVTADKNMVPELKKLWKICFGDSDEYIANFFKKAFIPEHTMVALKDGAVAGAAYLFPCTINGKKASYLYAGGVFPEFRRQGIYEKMMHTWSDWCIERDIIPFLKPADDKLWDYYERIGFGEFMGGNRVIITDDGTDECSIEKISAREFSQMRSEKQIKWQHMEYIVSENEICGGDCVRVMTTNGEFAMVYAVVENALYVRGFAGNIDVLKTCAENLMEKIPSSRICMITDPSENEYIRLTAAVGAKKIHDGAADLLMD